MHPPFGFALFYLRSVAPSKEYTDRVTKKLLQPVTTMQIYWGAVPFVLIQIVMVGLIIFFPGIVTGGLDKTEKVDLNKVMQEMNKDLQNAAPPMPAASGVLPDALLTPAQEQAQEQKSEAEEQKKIDDLFKK
jgi:hypothetical protein